MGNIHQLRRCISPHNETAFLWFHRIWLLVRLNSAGPEDIPDGLMQATRMGSLASWLIQYFRRDMRIGLYGIRISIEQNGDNDLEI